MAPSSIWGVIIATRLPWRISSRELAEMALLSMLGYGGGSTLLFLSLLYLPASLASMLLYTYPVMVALTEAVLFKQPLTKSKAAALLLACAGLVMVLGTNFQGINPQGTALALAAAVFYTAYLIYGKRVNSYHPPMVTTGYILAFAAAAYLGYAVLSGKFSLSFGPTAWYWIAGLGFFGTALAIFALFAGMKWLRPSQVSIISCIEPVFSVVCAALLFGEAILPLQMVGGVIVLAAIVIIQVEW
ncbi:MAG: EamA family transporter [Firmicutes bacterium]|nr:EamA family transporter [Bacillota bacterium]